MTLPPHSSVPAEDAWRGFTAGLWQRDINVRWFIQQNYRPYEGDEAFLASVTERTRDLWRRLEALFVEEWWKWCANTVMCSGR